MDGTARKLARIRAMLSEVAELVAEIEVEAEQKQSFPVWVETAEAAEALDIPLDSVRKLCRQKGYGRKDGGRWQANLTALRRYFVKRDNRDGTHRVSSATTQR